MAMNGDGLFSRARDAADKYKKAQEDEAELISEIGKEMNSEYVGAYITGYTPKEGTCEISKEISGVEIDEKDSSGNKIESIDEKGSQTFTTTEEGELNWRIWDYDGKILRIILDRPTTQKLALKGVEGYNNGVWVMNEVCRECFASEDEGVTVRNLRRSDIEKVSNYDYTKYSHRSGYWKEPEEGSSWDDITHFGETKKYEEKFESPAMWEEHDMEWNYEYDTETKMGSGNPSCETPWEEEFIDEMVSGTGNTTAKTEFKQSYYAHIYQIDEFDNANYYDLTFPGGSWTSSFLATRMVYFRNERCSFGFMFVNNNDCVIGDGTFNSRR